MDVTKWMEAAIKEMNDLIAAMALAMHSSCKPAHQSPASGSALKALEDGKTSPAKKEPQSPAGSVAPEGSQPDDQEGS